MIGRNTYSLVGFADGLLAMSYDGTRTYHYREPGELATVLRLLHVSEPVIEDFRTAHALGIMRVERNVVLTPEMLNWFD
jgi:hypothetical protein